MTRSKGMLSLTNKTLMKQYMAVGFMGVVMTMCTAVAVYIGSMGILTICSSMGCLIVIILGFHGWYSMSHVPEIDDGEIISVHIRWHDREKGQAFIEMDDDPVDP